MFCFDFRSNFLVSISFLINIGKEMSLPGFRRKVIDSSSGEIKDRKQSVARHKDISNPNACI